MALAPGKIQPLVEVRLYGVAAAGDDPYLSDRGFAATSFLEQEHAQGTIQTDASGREYLEYLDGVGLTCRPTLVPKDTETSHFTTSGGSWEHRSMVTGKFRANRLWQYSTTAGTSYSATLTRSAPANPHFAFSLDLPDTPADWNSSTHPPYVRVEFGGSGGQALWAVHLEQGGAYLLYYNGSAWVAVKKLKAPSRGAGYADNQEQWYYVRCTRGLILVSSDFGESYDSYGDIADPITVASAPIVLRGQGGAVGFGLHQLSYAEGQYTAPSRPTLTSRVSATVTFFDRTSEPSGTSITYTDLSSFSGQSAQYRATLSPTNDAGTPWAFHNPPVLHTAVIHYAPVALTSSSSYTTPWTAIQEFSIEKPLELHASSCSFKVKLAPGSSFSGNYRRRKIQVRAGWKKGGVETYFTVFTGYIRTATLSRDGFGDLWLSVTADNILARMKRTSWDPFQVRPLGGNYVNTAADYILTSEGVPLNSSWRVWHTRGDTWMLPAGRAEEPFELIRPQEKKWETLKRLFSIAQLEVAATDAGVLTTGPRDYYSATVHNYRLNATGTDLHEIALSISVTLDYDQSATAVLVGGKAENSTALYGWAYDYYAEVDTASNRWCPWRELVQEDVRDTCDVLTVGGQCSDLAIEHLPLKQEVEVTGWFNPNLSRRDQVAIYGASELGITDGQKFVIMTLNHSVRVSPDAKGAATWETRLGLRRLWGVA